MSMINHNEPVYVPTAQDIAETQAAEKQLDRDPLARIRPIVTALHMSIKSLAPMFPNQLLQQHLTEAEVYKFLCELEKHGYTITPCD